MGDTILITVTGVPKAQPRPRAAVRRIGGVAHARVYNAATAEGWKSLIAVAAAKVLPQSPWTGPVAVRLDFYMPRPKAAKKNPDKMIPHDRRPDIDNLTKAVLDVLTSIGWWRDDAQVASLEASKHCHAVGGRPGMVIAVSKISVDLLAERVYGTDGESKGIDECLTSSTKR